MRGLRSESVAAGGDRGISACGLESTPVLYWHDFSECNTVNGDAKDDNPRQRAEFAFAAFMVVGVLVWGLVVLLTHNLALGLLYGLLPGVALGLLARARLLNGRLIGRGGSSDKQDRGTA